MVTAEFAVALPAFVLVVLAALAALAVVTAQLRCADAAGVAARMAARGEVGSLVRSAALATAPGGARLSLAENATTVTATVRARFSIPGLGRLLPAVSLSEYVVDAREPSAPTPASR
jgi:hypothetical protein